MPESRTGQARAHLAGDGRGAIDLDDITLFLTYIFGFLADFRFRNIGVGFGTEGLRQVLVGRQDAHTAARVEAEIHDRPVALVRRYVRAERAWYLAGIAENGAELDRLRRLVRQLAGEDVRQINTHIDVAAPGHGVCTGEMSHV
jgi:hypothetical protein